MVRHAQRQMDNLVPVEFRPKASDDEPGWLLSTRWCVYIDILGFSKFRDRIRDGSRIMASLVPAIVDIMQQDIDSNPDSEHWGRVAYPRIIAEPE